MEPYSILLAVWREDNPDHFREAIESMLSQTYPAEECIIVKGIIKRRNLYLIDMLNHVMMYF